MTTTPPTPRPLPTCQCGQDKPDDERVKRLRRLRDGLQRNTVAVTRIIDELIGEIEQDERRAA